MYGNAYNAYEKSAAATMSGREIEARVLSKAAAKLRDCQKNWDSENRRADLEEACTYNQRVWSILQAELAKPDHPMDKKLRQNLLNLSVFIDSRIFEMLVTPDREKLSAIININNGLAAGLRSRPMAEQ